MSRGIVDVHFDTRLSLLVRTLGSKERRANCREHGLLESRSFCFVSFAHDGPKAMTIRADPSVDLENVIKDFESDVSLIRRVSNYRNIRTSFFRYLRKRKNASYSN